MEIPGPSDGVDRINDDPLFTMAASLGSTIETSSTQGNDMDEEHPDIRRPNDGMFFAWLRGLPYTTTVEEMCRFLGNVREQQVLLCRRKNGKLSGSAFIAFSNARALGQCLEKDHEYMGSRYIEVFYATLEEVTGEKKIQRPTTLHPPKAPPQENQKLLVFVRVTGLDERTKEANVMELLSNVEVQEIVLHRNRSREIEATVGLMGDKKAIQRVLALDGSLFRGHTIQVEQTPPVERILSPRRHPMSPTALPFTMVPHGEEWVHPSPFWLHPQFVYMPPYYQGYPPPSGGTAPMYVPGYGGPPLHYRR